MDKFRKLAVMASDAWPGLEDDGDEKHLGVSKALDFSIESNS